MQSIMVINPRKVTKKKVTKKRVTKKKVTKKKVAKKKSTKSAKKKVSETIVKFVEEKRMPKKAKKKTAITTTTTKKRVYKSNPKPKKKGKRKDTGKLSFKNAIRNVLLMNMGAFSAKFSAKLFGMTATETDPATWNWLSYIKGSIGTISMAFLMNQIKRGTGQRVLDGGLAYIGFKLLENELISKNETMTKWLGDDDEPYAYMGTSDPNVLVLDDDETPYIQGSDGYMLPLDERHRMMGDSLTRPGPLGDSLARPGRLGSDSRFEMLASYAKAWQ